MPALAWTIGIAAVAAEAAAGTCLSVSGVAAGWVAALAWHAVAALLTAVAVGSHRAAGATAGPDDVVLAGTVALLVPVFGPCCLWWSLRPDAIEADAAGHLVAAAGPLPGSASRRRFGDPDAANAASFAELLRAPRSDQRRNTLRTLAALGGRHHFALLRSCLASDDIEIRLGAFAELDRLRRSEEDRIAAAAAACGSLAAEPAPDPERQAAALLELAEAHRRVASSGLVDQDTAQRHWRECCAAAMQATELCLRTDTVIAHAMALSELGQHARAVAELQLLPPAAQSDPQVMLVAARIAWQRRDFPTVAELQRRLARQRIATPAWMRALVAARRPALSVGEGS